MVGRLRHVGSNETTGPVIEAAFARLIKRLEPHLAARPYLFGARPCLADFGLASQLAQMLSDPTPGALLRDAAPNVIAWIDRVMAGRSASGAFESFDALAIGLSSLLREEIVAGRADGHTREIVRTKDFVGPILHLPSVLNAINASAAGAER